MFAPVSGEVGGAISSQRRVCQMSHQNDKPKPADLPFLMAELRRVSTDPSVRGKIGFWQVLRWHLRDRRIDRA
jgi:hypothetical protein